MLSNAAGARRKEPIGGRFSEARLPGLPAPWARTTPHRAIGVFLDVVLGAVDAGKFLVGLQHRRRLFIITGTYTVVEFAPKNSERGLE
jgi:hypothetical protein